MQKNGKNGASQLAGYKKKLHDAKQMQGQSGLAIFERITILADVFGDRDFRADSGNIDDFKAAEIMDGYLSDLAYGFLELRNMLGHYPRRQQWESGRLRYMRNEMLKLKAAKDAEANRSTPTRTRESVKVSDYQAVVEQKAEIEAKAETEARAHATELEKARKTILLLTEENSRLKNQVATLKQQLKASRFSSAAA